MSLPTAVVTFKKTVLTSAHVTSLNALTASPVTPASHASSLGITQAQAASRLQLLADEGLAIQVRSPNNANGATPGTYTSS
jgi:hypothetical protein